MVSDSNHRLGKPSLIVEHIPPYDVLSPALTFAVQGYFTGCAILRSPHAIFDLCAAAVELEVPAAG